MAILISILTSCAAIYLFVQMSKAKVEAEEARKDQAEKAHLHAQEMDQVKGANLSLAKENTRIKDEATLVADENSKYRPMIDELKTLEVVRQKIKELSSEQSSKSLELDRLKQRLNAATEYKELKEAGFFTYKYRFAEILNYKEALQLVKAAQRGMISSKNIVICSVEALRGSPLIKNLTKLALLSLNNEFELIADRVSSTNFDSCNRKLADHFDDLNELIAPFNCHMRKDYLALKVKELALAAEYELELQKAREAQNALKEQMRDELRAREEAEEAVEESVEEEQKYAELLAQAKEEANSVSKDKQEEMTARIAELETQVENARLERERRISLAQITRRGHVYIISNIGSFGENVFKIGLTRRERPEERVEELSNASVPFAFDIHAVIQSEDAPKLEYDLHHALGGQRINKVNSRKEFFRASISEIEKACSELGQSVQIVQTPAARDYRETLEILKKAS